VKPSKKHGLGLFATKDIDPSEIITLYPADGVRLWLEDGKHTVHLKRFAGMTTDTCVDYSAAVPAYRAEELRLSAILQKSRIRSTSDIWPTTIAR
jgi:hypothetical protein